MGNIHKKTPVLESFNKVAGLKAGALDSDFNTLFSCEYPDIFKNTYFEEHQRTFTFGTAALKNFAKLTRKQPLWSLTLSNIAGAGLQSY